MVGRKVLQVILIATMYLTNNWVTIYWQNHKNIGTKVIKYSLLSFVQRITISIFIAFYIIQKRQNVIYMNESCILYPPCYRLYIAETEIMKMVKSLICILLDFKPPICIFNNHFYSNLRYFFRLYIQFNLHHFSGLHCNYITVY